MGNEELWQRMLSGKMYNDLSSELTKKRRDAVLLTNRYNNSYGEEQRVRESILREILGDMGENVNFEPYFRCEFGSNICIGNNFFANFDCVILDCNRVVIGNKMLVVFQKVCLGRSLQILQICKYNNSCFQIHTPRRVDLIFVL